jgi:hypothetical protein
MGHPHLNGYSYPTTLLETLVAIRGKRKSAAGDLNVNARREFMAQTQSAIERGDTTVQPNCSVIDVIRPVDDGLIGLLAALVRAAQSQVARLGLTERRN